MKCDPPRKAENIQLQIVKVQILLAREALQWWRMLVMIESSPCWDHTLLYQNTYATYVLCVFVLCLCVRVCVCVCACMCVCDVVDETRDVLEKARLRCIVYSSFNVTYFSI